MSKSDEMSVFLMTRISECIEKGHPHELRVVFFFFACHFPAEARALYERMPEELRKELHEYKHRIYDNG